MLSYTYRNHTLIETADSVAIHVGSEDGAHVATVDTVDAAMVLIDGVLDMAAELMASLIRGVMADREGATIH